MPLAIWLFICLLGGAIYLRSVSAEFIAGVQLLLQSTELAQDGPEQVRTSRQFVLDWQQAETELNVLRSERLLREVFDALDLKDDPELRTEENGFWNGLSGTLRRFGAADRSPDPAALTFDHFTRRVAARRLALSYVVEISYRSGSAAQAERVANALAAAYLHRRINRGQNGMPYLEQRAQHLLEESMIASTAMQQGEVPSPYFRNAGVRLLGPAVRPLGKAFPKAGPVMAVALFWGAIIGLFGIAVLQHTDRRIRGSRSLRAAIARTAGPSTRRGAGGRFAV